MTHEVLAENADTRATVSVLEHARTIFDMRIYLWDPRSERWRMLSHRDQKLLWEMRG
jgi:hypothetical protein